MFGKKTVAKVEDNRYDIMIAALDKIIAGDYKLVTVEEFGNEEVVNKVNEVITAFYKANNNFVMRANEAMQSIGDNSYVKAMLDQVISQQSNLQNMEGSSRELESSIDDINISVEHIRDNTHKVLIASQDSAENMKENVQVINESATEISKINVEIQNFHEKINKISEIIDLIKKVARQSNLLALNASIEAARAGEAGKGFAVVADQVRELSNNTATCADDIVTYVSELQNSISDLAETMDGTTRKLGDGSKKVESSIHAINDIANQMNYISNEIDSIYLAVDKQSDVTKEFTAGMGRLNDSYGTLYNECHKTGEHIYKIGRYIDTLRSDMYRGFSKVTMQDTLKIFVIDHFILTWRVYNNAVGFETLKLTQLNNPTGPNACKIGKWLQAQTESELIESAQFKKVREKHIKFHDFATKSWEAKDKGDEAGAIMYFSSVLGAFDEFKAAMEELMEFQKSRGYTDYTEVVVFRK